MPVSPDAVGIVTGGAMSVSSAASTPITDDRQRWAALDKQNERLVDASHPLLAELRELRRDNPEFDRRLYPAR